MKAAGKHDRIWLILFGASFAVYLAESESLRTFVREFVRLTGKLF